MLRSRGTSIICTVIFTWMICFISFTTLEAREDGFNDSQKHFKNLHDQFSVFDAHGKFVGMVINAGHPMISSQTLVTPEVLFEMKGKVFGLWVFKNRFLGSFDLFFESNDCSGEPLLEVPLFGDLMPLLPSASVLYPGNVVYIGDSNESAPEKRNIRSILSQTNGECFDYTSGGYVYEFNVVPARPLIDLDSVFTPPFKVR